MNKILRKESTSDMQSRLKSRKLLGVGETSSGDIHVSKVSQVLGNDDRYAYYTTNEFPVCSFVNVILLAPIGLLGVLWPCIFDWLHYRNYSEESSLALRLHAAALFGLAYVAWKLLSTSLDIARIVALQVSTAAQLIEAAIGIWGLFSQLNQGKDFQTSGQQSIALTCAYVLFCLAASAINVYHYLILSRSKFLNVVKRARTSLPLSDFFKRFLSTTDSNNNSFVCNDRLKSD